jgi:type II restriction enzyme
VLTDFSAGRPHHKKFCFQPKEKLSEEEISAIGEFASKTRLLEMFQRRIIKSVTDYLVGVEVGLDSNGRKNRGGSSMEAMVRGLIKPICENQGYELIEQAAAERIRTTWGVKGLRDGRKFDFAIKTPTRIFLIEVNYYSGNGSKLKAVAGELQMISEHIRTQDVEFIWITDGLGWLQCLGPLRHAFEEIDYVLNLDMILKGTLKAILASGRDVRGAHKQRVVA